jgi:hypothetical protein
MLALIAAPGQYVRPRMRQYSPDLRVVRVIVRFCAPQGCSADPPKQPVTAVVLNLSLCVRRAAPSAVASDHSLRHASAGGARSRAISARISLNI